MLTKAKNKKEEDKKEKESLMEKSQDDQKQEHSDSSYCRETFQRKIGKIDFLLCLLTLYPDFS